MSLKNYDFPIELHRKNIKNLYIRILPPSAIVRVTAPQRMSTREIESIIDARLPWIQKHRARLAAGPKFEQSFSDGSQVPYFGRPLVLTPIPSGKPGRIPYLENDILYFPLLSTSSHDQSLLLLNTWYRAQLRTALGPLQQKWEHTIGVTVAKWTIRDMKTRWGSCNVQTHRISLNLQLVKYPLECLEYVIIHELVHLLEPSHNAVFWSLVEQYAPNWRHAKAILKKGEPIP